MAAGTIACEAEVQQSVPRSAQPAAADRPPAHLLLGSDAAKNAGEAEATRAADAERWRDISVSTDFDARGALPDVRF